MVDNSKCMQLLLTKICKNVKNVVSFFLLKAGLNPKRKSIIRKKNIFSGLIDGFRIELIINQSTFPVQLLINTNELTLLPAAKMVEFINFSGPKRSLGRRGSADCKQRGTK